MNLWWKIAVFTLGWIMAFVVLNVSDMSPWLWGAAGMLYIAVVIIFFIDDRSGRRVAVKHRSTSSSNGKHVDIIRKESDE